MSHFPPLNLNREECLGQDFNGHPNLLLGQSLEKSGSTQKARERSASNSLCASVPQGSSGNLHLLSPDTVDLILGSGWEPELAARGSVTAPGRWGTQEPAVCCIMP